MSGQYEKALKDHPAMDRIVREAEAAARLQAFEEAAKIADARSVLYQGKIEKRGHGLGDISREDLVIASEAIASAIRQHAKGDGK